VTEIILESIDVLVADHCIGFAGASGAVREHGCVIAVEDGFDERLNCFDVYLNWGISTVYEG
jgi:hypothetical protein